MVTVVGNRLTMSSGGIAGHFGALSTLHNQQLVEGILAGKKPPKFTY